MGILGYYLHHLNPYIFKVWGFGPRYYGVAYLLGFLCAYLLMQKLARDGMLRMTPARVPDLVLNACIFGVLVGGRMGFVLFYDLPASLQAGHRPLLWDFTSVFPFWGVLRVWDGGMSAHGGIIFSILALMVLSWQYTGKPTRRQILMLVAGTFVLGAAGWLAAHVISGNSTVEIASAMVLGIGWMVYVGWRNAIPVINVGDASCMVVPIGLFCGRVANFINGELYGHPSTVPWAVKFPSEIYAPTNGESALSPVALSQINESIAQYIFQNPGQLTPAEIQSFLNAPQHAVLRQNLTDMFGTLNLQGAAQLAQVKQMIGQSLMANPNAIEPSDIAAWWQGGHTALTNAMGTIFDKFLQPRHPSQLYEALLEGALLFLICWTIGRRWRKDGMASGAFLTLYPVMRIIGEQFRVGDSALNGSIGAGILYSLPMFFAGAIYWGFFIARSKPNVWQKQSDEPPQKSPPSTAQEAGH